jgi:Zn-dependent M28 family amino/carboxypeptidase
MSWSPRTTTTFGTDPSREADPIFNGANDDGSGTVSVIELASALSRLNPRLKRAWYS